MSATTVYNALNGFIQPDKTIDLWAAANGSHELAGMVPVLGLFNVTSRYVLTEVVLSQSPDGASVILTGKGVFAGGVSYPVNARLQYSEQGNIFSLSLAIIPDWVFSDFFPSLPETLMQDPAVALGITWYPSVLNGMRVRAAVFLGETGREELTLTGFLLEPANEYLLSKTPMIGPYPLSLSGTVALPKAARPFPLIDLDALGNSTTIQAVQDSGVPGPSAIALSNPGLNLLVQPLEHPMAGNIAFSTIQLFGYFALGEITGRISTLILSTGKVWNFIAIFDKETASLVQGLAQLTRLFGVELPVPMDFPVLSDFYVAEIDIDLQNNAPPNSMPSFSLLNFAITIQSDKVWDPPIPFVTFSKVGTRWVWGWTVVKNESGVSEKVYSLTGSVFGNIVFGGNSGFAALPPPPDSPPGALVKTDEALVSADLGQEPVVIFVKMSLPDFFITGTLADDTYISISDALDYFFGNSGPSTGMQQMNITELRFTADPLGQNYYAQAVIFFGNPSSPDPQQGWEINLFIITIILEELEFYIAVNGGKVSGGINGTFFLEQGDPSNYLLPRILISAEYPPQNPDAPEGWTLRGYLFPGTSINLTKLVYQFIYGKGQQPPEWVPDVTIDRLDASFTTGSTVQSVTTKPSYKFGGTASVRWTPTIFNTALLITASASIDIEKPATTDTPSGKITGMFSVNRLMLTASLTFGVPEPTYFFKVQFDNLWLSATTSWRGEANKRHQVVSLQLGGVTLGDILEYLVNLAAPTLGFRLDPPWDLLKQVDLSRFVLTIDPQDNIIEFVFNANVNLVIAQINSIGVRYSKNEGEGKVDLILTGSFLEQKYTSDKPLSWDVINDPPPAVPGQGTSLVNLRYIGIGQRVSFSGPTPNTVAESIKMLRDNMTPPPKDGNPLPNTMIYAADSQWLIGLDIQLMETVDLAIIFNDPKLYGLSIALGGEKAGSLAGLRFEILYKKITDDIGMFRIEFQVPDMFRTIQLGVVSITLGIIVIEIYTNGNFKIDLGFPYNQDFSRSFSLQASIFIGRGGFYFGLLNGDTSTQVPRISNGNFSPVIELGIGIAAGIGREIRAGILSGGAYVELQVIFQGVLAWFNPNSSGTASSTYFKCQGMAALHGKIYGSVDFVVVKVSVTLEAYAQVSILYESYQPMLIKLSVSVSAEASLKILFITVHFSFSVKLELEFTLGSAQPTPWILSNNSSSGSGGNKQLRAFGNPQARSGYQLRANTHRRMLAMRNTYHATMTPLLSLKRSDSASLSETYILNWKPDVKVFNDAPRKAHLTLLPLFTIANVPADWSSKVPTNNNPDYRTAFVLFGDSGMSPDAVNAAQCAERSSAHSAMTSDDDDTSLLAADILTQGLLLYAIGALPRDPAQGNNVTAHDLSLLLEQLDLPEAMSDGLSIANLIKFFTTNINLWISGDTNPRPELEKSAMVLPIPPFLRWTSSQGGNVDFSNKNEIGPWYEWGISQLLNQYFPVSGENGEKPSDDNPATDYESFTSFMFRDFCLMLMQNAIKEMQKHMNDTTVTVTTVSGKVQSLDEVAATLPKTSVHYTIHSGDTIESVAANLGATVEELEFLNQTLVSELQTEPVGTVLTIILGIAPEILALDNPEKVFVVTQCDLGTLVHQAGKNETLQSIAALFQVASVSSLLGYQDNNYPVLSSSSNILQAGASFNLPQQTFANAPVDFVQLRTAAVFFVRYTNLDFTDNTPVRDMSDWYIQAITELNQNLLKTLFPEQSIPSVIELPPGHVLTVPNFFGDAYSQPDNRNNYTTVAGDTLYRIGYALTFQQDFASSQEFPQWQTFKSGVTSSGANSWNIAAQTRIKVDVGQTIESLVRRLIISASWTASDPNTPASGTWTYDWTAVAAWLGPADVLMPLAAITVPNAKTAVSNSLSFNVLSQTYGLTIVDAAARLKTLNKLFADGTVLLVKSLPAQDIDVLVNLILKGDSFASIVNQSSRMLMSGLQLPGLKTENGHVVPDESNALPLYDLTGQQFSLTVDDSKPTETALALALFSEQPWITLFASITVQQGQTLAGLEATYPDLLTYNPGLNESNFKVGMILLTAPEPTSLNYNYTNKDITDASPASGLAVSPSPSMLVAPSVLEISGTVPRTYGLEHRIELQTPTPLPIPQEAGQQNVTGNPGMWMLPDDLQAKARANVTTLYEILAAPQGGEAGREAIEINNSTFGTIIPFKIKQLEGSTSQFNLIGVDTDKRYLLTSLSNWLKSQGMGVTQVYQLLSPAPDAANTSGLTVLTASPASAFLIKSNLSTLSVPPSLMLSKKEAAPGDVQNVYYASLSSLADFLTLLWEGSVVGGSGYYFSPGQDIPGSAFDQQGNITLQLLVIVGTQQSLAQNGRSLLPFNNCALIGTGVQSSQLSVFIQSAGSTDPSETITQALVPPGNVGFDLVTVNPATQSGTFDSKEILLKTLYSLLSFEVAQTSGSPFYAPASGMPVLPDGFDGTKQQPWERERALRKAKVAGALEEDAVNPVSFWQYKQVMPVSRFILAGTALAAPDVPGLPPASGDPYQGYGTQAQLPSASFVFKFGDVLGNRTGSNGAGQGTTSIPVGYTDNLIGVGDWASIARSFNVAPSLNQSGAELSVIIAPRPSELIPTPLQPGNVNADTISQQQNHYSQTYYQLIQPGVTGWVVSSLNYIADTNYGNKGVQIADISPLWKFAAGSYAFLSGLSQMQPAKPVGAATLGDIITKFGVRYTELGYANANFLVADLFGATLPAVPAFYPFVEHQSINQLYAMPPIGYPKPLDAKALLTLTDNTKLLLRTGTGLIIPTKSISTGTTQPTATLEKLASSGNTTVNDLASQNAAQTILQIGFEFSVPVDDTTEVTIAVTSTNNSLDLMVSAFAAEGVNITAENLAGLHKDAAGMFAVNQTLNTKIYLIKEGDTLDKNSSGQTADTLASLNLDTEDIFDPGALVYFGNFAGVTAGSPPPTLQQFADRYACPVELLLKENASFALPSTTAFVVPGTLSFPQATDKINVPYTIRKDETLNAIAQRFDFNTAEVAAGMQLATINENMPGTIQPGITLTIPVGGTNYNVQTGSGQPSFASVLKSLRQQAQAATLQDVVNAIGDTAGDLCEGGLFICPPAKFSQAAAPNQIYTLYGLTPSTAQTAPNFAASVFALANAATQNLLAPKVVVWNADKTVSVTTAANDTLNSLTTRFADKGVSISANEIVLANMTAKLFAANARAFIPPAEIKFTVNIGDGGPYLSPIAPLQASLRIIRPPALIYPSFKTVTGTGPVEMVESDFPAPVKNESSDSGLTLNDFVAEMKQALPNLRLGTGKVTGFVQDIWQVDFDANGIKQVQLLGGTTVDGTPQPRFFALTPLYPHLVTRTLPIKPLSSDGTLGTAQEISFQSIDTEPWARRFVEEMDRFLSGAYASAVYADTTVRSQLNTILDAKKDLAPAIAEGLKTVLDVPDPGKASGENSAQKALEQQLGVSLSKTYESTVMIQYDSVVDSAWQHSSLKPASLYGDGKITDLENSVPSLTMISAKTDLAQANSFVNFLMTLDNPSRHRVVSGSFEYALSNLEFNIASENLPGGYKSSDWLTFIPLLAGQEKPSALTGTDPGDVDIPVPLRNFPELPKIVQQHAGQSYPDGTQTVNELSLWDYEFIYSHQHAAQDYVLINAEFNLKAPQSRALAEVEPRDLFTELAQYIYVTEQLWNMLNGLVDPKTTFTKTEIENAVQTYATLVKNIAQYWGTRLPQSNFNNNPTDNLVAAPGFSYHFNARVTYNNAGNVTAYTLTKLDAQPGPNNNWADVYIQVPPGSTTMIAGTYIKLERQPTVGNDTVYKVPSNITIPSTDSPVFKLIWAKLNLATVQNARSKISVERNQKLLDSDVKTNPVFLLSTDTVIAPAVVTPLNTFGERVDITNLGTDLTTALNTCFTNLFDTHYIGQIITMELSYGFELVTPSQTDPGLVTYLPIGLYPNQTLSATTASELATAIDEWQTDNQPVETGGEWVFSLKLYSQLTNQTQTLLNIAHLVYRISSTAGLV
jgi:LysM repeat protein